MVKDLKFILRTADSGVTKDRLVVMDVDFGVDVDSVATVGLSDPNLMQYYEVSNVNGRRWKVTTQRRDPTPMDWRPQITLLGIRVER